jgi:hypothetical protein
MSTAKLVAWAVFTVAAGVKAWHLSSLLRARLLEISTRTEQRQLLRLRKVLERRWQQDQQRLGGS